jgi:hypothetical protein
VANNKKLEMLQWKGNHVLSVVVVVVAAAAVVVAAVAVAVVAAFVHPHMLLSTT